MKGVRSRVFLILGISKFIKGKTEQLFNKITALYAVYSKKNIGD